MPNTYTLIASNTLSSSAASVTFSAIPNTYTDLVLRASTRIDAAVGGTWLVMFFNTDSVGSSTNYSTTRLFGTGSTAGSGQLSSDDEMRFANSTQGTSYTTSTFASTEIYIPSYTASQNKPVSNFGVTENNSTTATMVATAGLWRNTAAVNQLVFYPDSGNFVSGSSFFLYGIKNS